MSERPTPRGSPRGACRGVFFRESTRRECRAPRDARLGAQRRRRDGLGGVRGRGGRGRTDRGLRPRRSGACGGRPRRGRPRGARGAAGLQGLLAPGCERRAGRSGRVARRLVDLEPDDEPHGTRLVKSGIVPSYFHDNPVSKTRPRSSSIRRAPAQLDVVVRVVEDRDAGARSRLRCLRRPATVEKSTSSPSRPTHIAEVCGPPSGLIVASTANGGRRAAVDLVVECDAHAERAYACGNVNGGRAGSGSITLRKTRYALTTSTVANSPSRERGTSRQTTRRQAPITAANASGCVWCGVRPRPG